MNPRLAIVAHTRDSLRYDLPPRFVDFDAWDATGAITFVDAACKGNLRPGALVWLHDGEVTPAPAWPRENELRIDLANAGYVILVDRNEGRPALPVATFK